MHRNKKEKKKKGKKKYTATNELCKRRERKMVTYKKKKSEENSVSALQIHQSYQFYWDFSSLQPESPCSCVLEFPIQFPKHGINLSIRSESQYPLWVWYLYFVRATPSPLESSWLHLILVSLAELSKSTT